MDKVKTLGCIAGSGRIATDDITPREILQDKLNNLPPLEVEIKWSQIPILLRITIFFRIISNKFNNLLKFRKFNHGYTEKTSKIYYKSLLEGDSRTRTTEKYIPINTDLTEE